MKNMKQMPSKRKTIETLEKNRGNLIRTYVELKAPITFFKFCFEDCDIREIVDSYRMFQTRLAEERMFELLKSHDENTVFKSSKFVLEHLDRDSYAPNNQSLEIHANKEGEIDIRGIFGIQQT